MDLRQLQYVVALADSLSFTRAAERCHVVQSALSHQIQRLEAELDTRLFERTSRSVRTTEAGELLVGYARRILATTDEARAELAALAGLERGRLAVGATQTAERVLDVIALFGTFHSRHPGIKLASISGPASELVAAVRSGSLDLAFVAGSAIGDRSGRLRGVDSGSWSGDGVVWETLVAREPLVAVVGVGHRLGRRRLVRLDELAAAGTFVEFRPGTGLRTEVDRAFARAGVAREIVLELGRISDMVRFASHGPAIAVVPRVFAREPPADAAPYRTLRLVGEPAIAVHAVTRPGPAAIALRAFQSVVAAVDAPLSGRSHP